MSETSFTAIETAAHESAFGDNDLPTPTEAQCKAGNYRMGRVSIHGLRIAIEQPRGTVRSGQDRDGTRWSCRLAAHYGYFIGTKGADGDGVDVFVGPNPDADIAFVINQNVGGRFDEHKVVLGAVDEEHACALYRASYARDWRGLASVVPATIPQLTQWLRHGNKRRELTADHLNQQGTPMNRVFWNRDAQPEGLSLDQVLYQVRVVDAGDNLLMDSISIADIIEDSEGVLALDAMVIPVSLLNRKMDILKSVMERTGNAVKPLNVQVSEPFKQRGVTNIAALFELSDGQTISVYFHNPDTTPNKLAPTDDMISWKWLLNKKDITIVVAPERGQDLNPREVARRIMRLAEKNSAAFQRVNAKRAERMGNIQSLKDEIVVLEGELSDAQRELEAEQVLAEERLALPKSPITVVEPEPAGVADISCLRSADGLFVSFMPNTPKGEKAWNVINATPGAEGGKVLVAHADSTIEQLRAAGYTVAEAEATGDEDPDALLKMLAEPTFSLATTTPEFAAWLAENAGAVSMAETIESAAIAEGGSVLWGSDLSTTMDSTGAEGVEVEAVKRDDPGAVLAGMAMAKHVLSGAALDDANASHAIATLQNALETVTNNEPINRAEGNIAQADLEVEAAASFRDALEKLGAPVVVNAGTGTDGGVALSLDSAEEEDEDFDEDVEWEATPEEDDEDVALDGDFSGHPFRGNQHRKGSRTSGTAVAASINAKKVTRAAGAREARTAHRVAHHSHLAASLAVTTKNARRYHRKMAKLHAKHAGVEFSLDSVDVLDGVSDMHATAVLRNAAGVDVGMVLLYQDGSAGIRDAAGNRVTPVTEDASAAADGVKALLQGRGKANGRKEFVDAMTFLTPFLSKQQFAAMKRGATGEEAQFFVDKAVELATTIRDMPATYGQDGKGGEAVAYLHYFKGGADWYITEKDKDGGVLQAFGLADLFGDGGELGYISIQELVGAGVELDFHWTSKTINQIRGKSEELEPEPKAAESHYSDLTLQALIDNHGWEVGYNLGENGALSSVRRPFAGVGAVGGTAVPDGTRYLYAGYGAEDGRRRYIELTLADKKIRDWDGRDLDPTEIAAQVNAAAENFADEARAKNGLPAAYGNSGASEGATEGHDELVAAGVEAAKTNRIAKLLTSDYFTMDFEDDDVVVNEELRGQIEASLGEKLVEATVPGLEGQVTLVPETLYQTATTPTADTTAEAAAEVIQKSAQLEADKALFQSVIDGTVADILSPSLADDMEAAFLRHEGDAEMAGLFEQSVNAYQAAMLTATVAL